MKRKQKAVVVLGALLLLASTTTQAQTSRQKHESQAAVDINGVWDMAVQMPTGKDEPGYVDAAYDETNGLSGEFVLFGETNVFSGGIVEGDNFTFSGKLKVAFLRVKYTISGTISGDTFFAQAKTSIGTMAVTGKKRAS